MRIDLHIDRKTLEILVNGSRPHYSEFNNPLVEKAGHNYNDSYGRTTWNNLDDLSEEELYELYLICRDSNGYLKV